ncbi:MAG TPA: AI-2E family transporter [Polyangia bacterium]
MATPEAMTPTDSPTRFEKKTFGVLLAVAGAFFLWTVSPIWVPVFLGVMLAVVATPLQRRLERRFRHHPRLLAAAISFVTVALGLGLVVFMGYFVVRELLHYLTDVAPQHAAAAERWVHAPRMTRILHRVGQTPDGVMKQVQSLGHAAITHLTEVIGGLLAATSNLALIVIFTTITSYYLLLEGPALARFCVRMVPLPQPETRALMHEFHEVAIGTLLGIGVIALVQGTLGGLGFWIFGVGKPLVWGALCAVASLLPAIGTGIICLPAGIIYALSGHIGAGIGLLVYWGIFITSIPDYYLRPRLMKGHMRLHELLVLIAVFGGIEAFGAIGILVGPMFVAMFVTMLRIYERNYRLPSTEGRIVPKGREDEEEEELHPQPH